MNQVVDFSGLSNLRSIASTFNIKLEFLESILKSPTRSEFYQKMFILKKNGKGYRLVYKAINKSLSLFHKNLSTSLQKLEKEFVHDCAYGFVKGKSTFDNAKIHLNRQILVQFDIENFFKSINYENIKKIFFQLCKNDDIASILTSLTTVNTSLVEGLHTSPVLANLFFYDLDIQLFELAQKHDCLYTRYADDITFSTNFKDINVKKLEKEVSAILKESNLSLNNEKTRISKKGQPQYVTGLSVSNPEFPRIPRLMKKKIRQELYYIKKYGAEDHFMNKKEKLYDGMQRLNGWIIYCHAIEKELAKKFQDQILMTDAYTDIHEYNKRLRKKEKRKEELHLYFDETLYGNYFGMSCVLIQDENHQDISNDLNTFYDQLSGDQLIPKKGRIFHYCEDSHDVRGQIVDRLRKCDFQAYIVFSKLETNSYTKDDYLKIFYKVLFDRIHKNYDCTVHIYYEENNKIKTADIDDLVEDIKDKLNNQTSMVISINIQKITKQNHLSVIPDYVLGLFKDAYLKKERKDFEIRYCQKLSNKIRLVIDLDTNKYYSRYNPLSIEKNNKIDNPE